MKKTIYETPAMELIGSVCTPLCASTDAQAAIQNVTLDNDPFIWQ